MGLKSDLLQRIKAEVQNDPEGRGYSGKTATQIIALLNEAYSKQVVSEAAQQSRISSILSGFAAAPNTITAQDLSDALAS